MKGARLGLRVNPPSSQGAGRAPHFEMRGSAGGRAMKLQGLNTFQIALDLGVHPRAVNDRVSGAVRLHFVDRKQNTDDVFG